MTTTIVLDTLHDAGALLRGTHVVFASGRHGDAYVNKDAVYTDVDAISYLCRLMAASQMLARVDVVIGPAIGGVILAQWTAHHLADMAKDRTPAPSAPKAVYAEKDGDALVIRRGYDAIVRGRRTLVVEDVLTTGGSARRTVDAVRACGGEVVGVSALVNRGGITAESLGVQRLDTLVDIDLASWEASACPLCRAGVPVNTDVGHGAAFMAARNDPT